MAMTKHLGLEEFTLQPTAETKGHSQAWMVARVIEGTGYWLHQNKALELKTGDVLWAAPSPEAILPASMVGSFKLQGYLVQPRLLTGVLSVMDRHQLEAETVGPTVRAFVCPAQAPLARRFAELAGGPGGPGRAGLSLRCQLL